MLFNSSMRDPIIAVACFFLAGAGIIGFTTNSYFQLIFALVSIWAVMGLSWNLLGGYAGLFSFGHAAFFGLGAYCVGYLAEHYGVSPWIGWLGSGVVGAISGVVVGLVTLRLKGVYFTLAMLAYPLALLYLFEWLGLSELVIPMRRENGPMHMQFGDGRIMALIALAMLALIMLLSFAIERSRFGLALIAIRQNELAASAAGLPTFRWKMKAVALSGAIAALAGGLYAAVLLVITPHSVFGMLVSSQALIVTMFGGLASVWGPVIGAAVLVPLTEFLYAYFGATLPGIQGIALGVAIIAVILLMPQGLYWSIRDWWMARKQTTIGSMARAPQTFDVVPVEIAAKEQAVIGQELLKIQDVSLSFGGLKALSSVNISVRSGEVVGVIGPNGAGKTTLFNAVNGFVRPSEGRVELEGKALLGLRPHEVCALGLGRTFQTVRAFPRLTLLENVVVGAFGQHAPNETAVLAARSALEKVGLTGAAQLMASSLTNHELRLMELARALASNPKLILMDESFAGLASEDIDQMMPVILSLRRSGTTIVIIEHTMQAMVRLVDRLIVMDQGSIIAEGPPEDVVKNPAVISAYLGKKWVDNAQT